MVEAEVQERIRAATAMFNLTEAEVAELRRVLDGQTLKEAAAITGCEWDTIRQRRKTIYRKASVGSSGRLVALVLGVPKSDRVAEKEPVEAKDDPLAQVQPQTAAEGPTDE